MFWSFVSFIESKLAYVIVIMSMKTIYFACLDFTPSISSKIKNRVAQRDGFSASKNIETASKNLKANCYNLQSRLKLTAPKEVTRTRKFTLNTQLGKSIIYIENNKDITLFRDQRLVIAVAETSCQKSFV